MFNSLGLVQQYNIYLLHGVLTKHLVEMLS